MTPGRDIMADFRGFLERRKLERNMERNTMESQINGLVNNLHTDLDKMMMTKEKRRVQQLMSARSTFKLSEQQQQIAAVQGHPQQNNKQV